MKKVFFVSILMLISVTIWAQYTGVYEIYSNEQKIGESGFVLKTHPMGFVLNSTTTMTVGGTQTDYSAETFFDAGYHPSSYTLVINTAGGKQEISATFEPGKVKIIGSAGVQQSEQDLLFPTTGYILDQNIFGHLWVLGLALNPHVGNIDYDIVVPQLMNVVKLSMVNEIEKEYEGKNATHFLGTFGGEEIEMWVSHDSRIRSVLFPGQKIEVKLTDVKSLAEESTKLPENFHPITKSELDDADYMKYILKIKKFQAAISFDPQGKLERIYLNRRAQSFLGNVEYSNVGGEIEIKKMSHRVTLAAEWPLLEPLVTDPEYTSPAPGIDSDDPDIISRAKKIVEPAENAWGAARAINIWVNRNITYDLVRYTAKDAIIKCKGDSHTKALVCAAMLRAVGLPSRIVRGILFADVSLDHSWVEVFLGTEIGWAPMDPTTDEVDNINAKHISLWIGEEEPPVFAKDITVQPLK